MQKFVSLTERQRLMLEKMGKARKLRHHKHALRVLRPYWKRPKEEPEPKKPTPKPKVWLESHLTEVLERIIDDLGLDVPRRNQVH